jgi:hypothetical protein
MQPDKWTWRALANIARWHGIYQRFELRLWRNMVVPYPRY